MARAKRGINSQFIYTSKSYQHVNFVSIPFRDVLYKEGIKYTTYNDKRTGKEYSRYVFRTTTDAGFENERKIWYPDDYKHIPNNLKLNPTICLIWYLGDGGICNTKSSQNIKLSTQCFDKEEQEDILIPQLSHYEACRSDFCINQIRYESRTMKLVTLPNAKLRGKVQTPCPSKFRLKKRLEIRLFQPLIFDF